MSGKEFLNELLDEIDPDSAVKIEANTPPAENAVTGRPLKNTASRSGVTKDATSEPERPEKISEQPGVSGLETLEKRINYLIIISSIVIFLLFVQYIIYESVWLEYFTEFNLFPLVVLSVVVASAFVILLLPGVKGKKLSTRSLALFGGLALVAISPILILLQNTRVMGVSIGMLGISGFLIMLLGRAELKVRDSLWLIIFIAGSILILLTNVLGAFSLLRFPTFIGFSLVLSGFLLILLATFIMGKMMRLEGKLIGYFGVWTVGILAITLVPFHEAMGLNASRNYGPYDTSLIMGGLLCIGAGLFLAVYRRYEVARITSYIVKGNMLQDSGRFQEAIDLYNLAISKGINNEVVWTNKGSALRNIRKYDEALECFRVALDMNPSYEEALTGRGNVLARVGKFDAALLCYDAVLSTNPNNIDTLINRGVLLSLMDRIEEADSCIIRASKLTPMSENVWLGKAFIDRKAGRLSQEGSDYERALEIDRNSVDALIGKGNVFTAMEKYDEAIDCYDRALEINPKNTDAWSNSGMVFVKQEKYDEARERFEKALKNDQQSGSALSGMGYVLWKSGKADEGLAMIDKALSFNPNTLPALVYKGDILHGIGRYSDAAECYKKAVDINPNLKSVIKSLADSFMACGRAMDAQNYYTRLAKMEKEKLPSFIIAAPSIDVKKMIADMKKETVPAVVAPVAPTVSVPDTSPVSVQTTASAQTVPITAARIEKKLKKIDRGFNYLIYEERTKKTYELVAQIIADGVKVLCITPTFPTKLRKEYGLEKADILWVSESSEKDAINPKRLDFEIARAIGNFIRGNVDPVLVIDGFELLMLQNGYENVMKFIKKANDLASVNSATIIVPLNPSALKKEDLPLLTKEFDKVEDLMEV